MLPRAWRRWGVASAVLFAASAAQADEPPVAQLNAAVAIEGWRNTKGGLRRGSTAHAHAFAGVALDAERALGWRGAEVSVSAIYGHKPRPLGELVGDLHGLDNKDDPGGARLYEAWVRQSLPAGYAKLGLIDLNSEFNVNETGALLVNGAQGLGLEMGQLGWQGPSVHPQPQAGVVLGLAAAGGWKLGVFSGPHGPDAPRQRLSSRSLAILETRRETPGGGRVTLGVWRHSAGYGSTLAALSQRSGAGGYVLVEQPLWRGTQRRLDGFVRFGVADPKTQQIANDLNLGLALARPFAGREGEALALGLVSAADGGHFRRAHADDAAPPAHRETIVELTYRWPLADSVSIQPDVQYVLRPGAVVDRRDALVLGVRLEMAWSRGL